MSSELIKYAFTGGEISPQLFGRSDLEQYDLGMALARNWFVDFRGGLSTRPGFEFTDFVLHDDKETKFFGFRFSPDLANVYAILFGHNYVRFIQDGGYVLEADKTITNIAANVVTSAGHGFVNGDWVKISGVVGIDNINGRTFEVTAAAANTFQLKVVPDGSAWVQSGAYVSGGVAGRIYTVVSPYPASDLADLRAEQRRDLLRLTHPLYRIHNLIRNDATDWDLVPEVIGVNNVPPVNVSAIGSAAGAAGTVFAVTAILADGQETSQSIPFLLTGIVNYTTTAGFVTVNWNVHPDAVAYNVYRSIVAADGTKLTKGEDLGFIGKVVGTQFIDSNIIPDFAKTPPLVNDPFAPGAIERITVTAAGAGNTTATTVSVSGGGGTGFLGVVIVNSTGSVTAVEILSPGRDYVNPVVTFSGPGAGATATAVATPFDGIHPSVSAVFQQRQHYAATIREPLTFWASRPRKFSDFTFSDVTLENDSYEFEIDSSEVAPIRHMIPMRGGLVMMSQTGIWQLTGGSSSSVTPTNALADPQTYQGVSEVPPLKIGTDLIYVEGKGFSIRLLSYNEYARVYVGEDKSIVSNHFFENGKRIISWAFAENPFKVVYGVRTDGQLLAFTIVKEEKVFSWTLCSTRGQIKDVVSVQEGDLDRIYVVTRRLLNGRWTKVIERLASREFTFSEDAFCVDSGLSLGSVKPNAALNAGAATGNGVTFTASAGVFAPGDVGKILRMGGGKASVQTFISATQVTCNIVRDITDVLPQTTPPQVIEQAAGSWTLDAKVTTIGGLWHLEGETVSILGDGNVFPKQEVVNGTVTLEAGVTRAIIGLPYQCVAQSLPPTVSDAVIEGRRKRVVGVAVRLNDTRGLKTGRSLTSLYDLKYRTNELLGEPTELFDGQKVQMIDPEWNDEGQTYFVQDDPLPATLLGIVFDLEVGDDQ